MPRFTIDGEPIRIAYGFDEAVSEVFLSVYDSRLEYQHDASDEVNRVAESIAKDGGGSYFDLHTGPNGYGIKVSKETIREYLLRYGVPNERIDDLFNWRYGKPIGSTCTVCYKENTKKCSKCLSFYYCSRVCQAEDWPSHKNICKKLSIPLGDLVSQETKNQCSVCFKKNTRLCAKCNTISFCSKECQLKEYFVHNLVCNALPFPEKNPTSSVVYGFYLPEDAERVVLVQVPIVKEVPVKKSFLGDVDVSRSYMSRNPVNLNRVIKDMLIICYRDCFLIDGSKSNKLVQAMTKGLNSHDWRGPILITKIRGVVLNGKERYIDVDLNDFHHVVDFFSSYGNN